MGSLFQRGDRWFLSFKDAAGKWRQASAETTDKDEAARLLREVEDKIAAQRLVGSTGANTLAQYADRWVDRRREIFEADGKQFRSWKGDRGWLKNHVLPKIGGMRLDEIRPRHLKAFFLALRTGTAGLAPHSIRNVYGVLCSLFRDAAVDGLITSSPCILTDAELGKDGCVDPIAQAEDRYTRSAVESMIWSPALSSDERIFAALGTFAGLRLGGIAGLCWRDYQDAEPLWRLVGRFAYDGKPTKTDRPSVVPIHPALKLLLDEWKEHGWRAMFGREPTDTDPIVPRAPRKAARPSGIGSAHSEKTGGDLMDRVLEKLSIAKPAKKTHALRSTHITLLEEDGANVFYVQKWTHPGGRQKDAFDVYRRGNWDAMCREMIKLSLLDPFGGGQKGEQNQLVNSGGGGSRNRVSSQPIPAGTTGFDSLPIAAMSPAGTPEHGAPKALWRSPIGFVQPVEEINADPISSVLQRAIEQWRERRDVRRLRRELARLLAGLD
jgi:integrase